jgi:hypothetical protein
MFISESREISGIAPIVYDPVGLNLHNAKQGLPSVIPLNIAISTRMTFQEFLFHLLLF